MTKLVTLHNTLHRNLKLNLDKVEAAGAAERMVPVVLSEYLKLTVQYPIVFTKNGDTGKFLSVALLGFDKGENLFWKDNQWQGIYIPLNISRQPFFLGASDKEGEKSVLCIDTDNDALSESVGEDIFDQEGKASPLLERVKASISELMKGEAETPAFIDILLAHQLIMPLSLDITFADQSTQRVQGLYTIDEEKLDGLPANILSDLHSRGYLKPIYTMVASLGHMYSLIQKKNERLIA